MRLRLPRRALRALLAAPILALSLTSAATETAAATATTDPQASEPLPACAFEDRIAPHTTLDEWPITLLDTAWRLPAGYLPKDLVPVSRAGLEGTGQVRSLVLGDLAALVAEAKREGLALRSVSAFRSEARQAQVFASWESSSGHAAALAASARPGHSEHQLGTAIDFGSGASAPWSGEWGMSPEGRWMASNAWRFGWVLSYPEGSSPGLTCYQAEPWHFRYVGRDEAAAVHASALPLRAWLWGLQHPAPSAAASEATVDLRGSAGAGSASTATRAQGVAVAIVDRLPSAAALALGGVGLLVGLRRRRRFHATARRQYRDKSAASVAQTPRRPGPPRSR